jgi:hypothetical protein
MEDNRNTHQKISPWGPLQRSLFRSLWIAAVASNMATCGNSGTLLTIETL